MKPAFSRTRPDSSPLPVLLLSRRSCVLTPRSLSRMCGTMGSAWTSERHRTCGVPYGMSRCSKWLTPQPHKQHTSGHTFPALDHASPYDLLVAYLQTSTSTSHPLTQCIELRQQHLIPRPTLLETDPAYTGRVKPSAHETRPRTHGLPLERRGALNVHGGVEGAHPAIPHRFQRSSYSTKLFSPHDQSR